MAKYNYFVKRNSIFFYQNHKKHVRSQNIYIYHLTLSGTIII